MSETRCRGAEKPPAAERSAAGVVRAIVGRVLRLWFAGIRLNALRPLDHDVITKELAVRVLVRRNPLGLRQPQTLHAAISKEGVADVFRAVTESRAGFVIVPTETVAPRLILVERRKCLRRPH